MLHEGYQALLKLLLPHLLSFVLFVYSQVSKQVGKKFRKHKISEGCWKSYYVPNHHIQACWSEWMGDSPSLQASIMLGMKIEYYIHSFSM